MKVEVVPLERVKPYGRNPRRNEEAVAKVARSIKEFGFRQPLVVDRDFVLVVGHTRLLAAQKLGLAEVPVHVARELSPAQAKAYRLMDNRSGEEATWDPARLKLELADLEAESFDLEGTGFDHDELARLLGAGDGSGGEDDVPKAPRRSSTKRGQVYALGDHRLVCGDATDAGDVGMVLGGGHADLVVTDPPYNVDYEGTAGKITNDKLTGEQFLVFLQRTFRVLLGAMRPGASIYVCHADTEGYAFRGALVGAGFKLASCLIWRKNAAVLGHADYQWQHEPILYGWKPGRHRFYGDRKETTMRELLPQALYSTRPDGAIEFYAGERVVVVRGRDLEIDEAPSTVIEEPRPRASAEHPTMKPVALLERFVLNSSKPGDVVLDVFGGSGSTLIACEKLERRARLVELDPKFCDVIVLRWEQFTGRKARLLGKGGADAQRRVRPKSRAQAADA